MVNSGTGRNEKFPFPKFGNGKGMKKSIPKIREREGNVKRAFPKFGNGKGMKKSIPKVRERESEAFILGNDREREFPLTPGVSLGYMNATIWLISATLSEFADIVVEMKEKRDGEGIYFLSWCNQFSSKFYIVAYMLHCNIVTCYRRNMHWCRNKRQIKGIMGISRV